MKGDKIKYKGGYKYQLSEDYILRANDPVYKTIAAYLKEKKLILTDATVAIIPDKPIVTQFLELDMQGNFLWRGGYAWDGASGPTVDTLSIMRGSLVHDGGYQLLREGLISMRYRLIFDCLLRYILIEDGAFKVRAWYWYIGVRKGGLKSSTCEGERKIIIAP